MLQRLRQLLIGLLALTALAAQAGGLFLWEAENTGQRVWLLGSIHVGKPDFYPLPEPMEAAYVQADRVVVEADISDPSVMTTLLPQALLPESKSVSDFLTPDQNQQLDIVLKQLSLPRKHVERMKPWLLAISLSAVGMQAQGFLPQHGVDMHFLQRAKQDKKVVAELESLQGQFAVMNGFTDEEAVALLDATTGTLARNEMKSLLEEMVEAWRNGDSERMQALLEASQPDTPALRSMNEKLFARRNRAMVEKIINLAGTGVPLVIVGAGHLVGPDSILALLLARGFRVKQY